MVVTAYGERVLLASSGQRPGVLLNISRCADQPPTNNGPARSVGVAIVEESRFNPLVPNLGCTL